MKATPSIISAFGIGEEHLAAMEGIKPFVRQFADFVSASDPDAPETETVVEGSALLLGLRLSHHDSVQEYTPRHETMPAIQEAFSALGYQIDFHRIAHDMHSLEADPSAFDDAAIEEISECQLEDELDLGTVLATFRHGLARLFIRDGAPDWLVSDEQLLRKLRSHYVHALVTADIEYFDDDAMDRMADLASDTTANFLAIPDNDAMTHLSNRLRAIFSVEDRAAEIDRVIASDIASYDVPEAAYLHAIATISAIGDEDPENVHPYFLSLAYGSTTGSNEAEALVSLGDLVNDYDAIVPSGESPANPLLDAPEMAVAISVSMVSQILLGRIAPLPAEKMVTAMGLVACDIIRRLRHHPSPLPRRCATRSDSRNDRPRLPPIRHRRRRLSPLRRRKPLGRRRVRGPFGHGFDRPQPSACR